MNKPKSKKKLDRRFYSTETIDCVSTDPVLGEPLGFAQRLSNELLAEYTITDGLFIPGHSIANDCLDVIRGNKRSLYHAVLDIEGNGVGAVIVMEDHWLSWKDSGYLIQVFVMPKYRKKGIGTFLLKCANMYAKKNKVKLAAVPFDERGMKTFSKLKNISIKLNK